MPRPDASPLASPSSIRMPRAEKRYFMKTMRLVCVKLPAVSR